MNTCADDGSGQVPEERRAGGRQGGALRVRPRGERAARTRASAPHPPLRHRALAEAHDGVHCAGPRRPI